jgi:predicted heme/steroid binding protein
MYLFIVWDQAKATLWADQQHYGHYSNAKAGDMIHAINMVKIGKRNE